MISSSAESDSALHVSDFLNSALHVEFGAACQKCANKCGAVYENSALDMNTWRRKKKIVNIVPNFGVADPVG